MGGMPDGMGGLGDIVKGMGGMSGNIMPQIYAKQKKGKILKRNARDGRNAGNGRYVGRNVRSRRHPQRNGRYEQYAVDICKMEEEKEECYNKI